MRLIRVKIDAQWVSNLPSGRIDKRRLDATTDLELAAQQKADDAESMRDATKAQHIRKGIRRSQSDCVDLSLKTIRNGGQSRPRRAGTGVFELKTARDGKTFFSLKAGNGETILTSELYKEKASALHGIESVKTNALNANRYAKLTAKNGKFYFRLKAGNSQIIGKSEMYNSEAACDNAIASVTKIVLRAKTLVV
jgi:uncharacterized protein